MGYSSPEATEISGIRGEERELGRFWNRHYPTPEKRKRRNGRPLGNTGYVAGWETLIVLPPRFQDINLKK